MMYLLSKEYYQYVGELIFNKLNYYEKTIIDSFA